jgi:hypothetical protein
MKTSVLFFLIFLSQMITAQEIVDFEEFGINQDSFLNGSTVEGAFITEAITFPNSFTQTPEFSFWSGWSISSITDNETPGFTNEFSAITGSGNNESTTYAVSFESGQNKLYLNEGPQIVEGIHITNSTYAYLSMLDGDAFSKKFGGATGDDPDFFVLIIDGFLAGEAVDTTIEFYLADYRFDDNTQDFLIDEWTFVDLSILGEVDSIGFQLASSDVGEFGMNTPAYFCIDDVQLAEDITSNTIDINDSPTINIFPNPTTDYIQISGLYGNSNQLNIYNTQGQKVGSGVIPSGKKYNVSGLETGIYLMTISDNDQWYTARFMKM